MTDFYKKPDFYFIITPVVIAIWAILTSTVFISSAKSQWKEVKEEFNDSQPLIAEILAAEPERLKLQEEKKKMGPFNYNMVIKKFADAHSISDRLYSISTSRERNIRGKRTQTANLKIDNVKIEQFAKFLAEMLHVWPNLQCESLTLTKQNTAKDAWKAQLKYSYTFPKKR